MPNSRVVIGLHPIGWPRERLACTLSLAVCPQIGTSLKRSRPRLQFISCISTFVTTLHSIPCISRMSSEVQTPPSVVDYGTVTTLCSALGFEGERGPSRASNSLSTLASNFRKEFKQTHNIESFPLTYQDENAQQCASRFLFRYDHFFADARAKYDENK